jgi:fumarate reductase flavoprotein subunit
LSDDFDVLVIGAGACGLCAAIAAHDQGLSTAIVEKMDRPGGNSALSTGSVPAAASRFQREAGVEDDPETYFRDLIAIAGEADNPDLVRLMTQVSAETVEWLIDEVGARLKLVTAYKHIGHSVPRLHAPVSRRGSDLVDDLVAAVEKRDIPIAVGNSVRELIVEDGAVKGAVVDAGDGNPSAIRAAKTILAVNGFGANRDLVARFCPEIAGARYFGAHGSAGEAVVWGEKLGAALDNMAAYQGYAAVSDPHGGLLSWTTIEKGGILVGADARRFGDESTGYSGYARVVLAQGDHAYAIFDQRIFDIAAQEEEFCELSDYGAFKKAEDPGELAAACGLDADALREEIERYNASAAGKGVDAFGRREFGIAPLRPPYYAARVVPGMFHTQGGLRIDREARVLRGSGEPVPNLYAGGGAAAGISGRSGALGYASGNGLLTAVALGRIAALSAARALRADRR